MTVRVRPALASDVHSVVNELSSISRCELRTVGVGLQDAEEAAHRGIANGVALAGEVDGRAAFLFWFYPTVGATPTFFLSSPLYFQKPTALMFLSRRVLRECAEAYPKAIFVSHTFSSHPDVGRWFKLLGFKECRDTTPGEGKVFEYRAS